MSFEYDVQKMVYDALTAASLSAPVYDSVPQRESFPYVTIGEDTISEWDTVSEYGAECTIVIHTWSRARGRSEIKDLQAEVYNALHDQKLTVSGYNVVSVYFESSVSFMDADGLTRHGVQNFRVLIERELT